MGVGYLACSFDLLNIADLDLIRQAHLSSERLVVGVFSDDYVAVLTGRAPVVPLVERLGLVAALRDVDVAEAHDESRPYQGVRRFRVSRCHGSDGIGTCEVLVPVVRTASVLGETMTFAQQEVA